MRFGRHILILTALALLPGALPAQTNAPAAAIVPAQAAPAFEVKSYRFEGETFLPPEKLSGTLSDYTGTVGLARLRAGLVKLQQVYRQSDYTNVSVTIPHQKFSDGVVLVKIISRAPAAAPAAVTSTAAKPPPALAVKTYRIEGNTVLPPQDFGVLSDYTGINVTFPRLREGLGKVQLRYRELGFPTISVTLPQQRITNGLIRVKVVEGRLGQIRVTGNGHFSPDNVRRALPSLTTNILLNTKWFQPELDQANQNRDRQIYPVIEPGLEPGTSDLTLKVKDRFPLHGRFEINDKSAPGTPLLRSDTAIQYGNLWQLEHQIGFDYNFSPQEYKSSGDANGFSPDRPLVASFSGFYRIPLGGGGGLREDYDQKPVTFGYDEISHKFNLPPPSGHPDLTVYGSHSSSDTSLQYFPVKTIFTNQLADISQQDVTHSPTINDNIGAKLTIPLPQFAGITSALSLGADWKSYSANTCYTNLTYFDLYALDAYGNRVLVTNQTVPLSANSSHSLFYVPLSFGWAALRPDKTGSFQFTFSEAVFLSQLESSSKDFQQVAGNTNSGGNFTTLNAGLVRQQNLPGNWSIVANANGQWASQPLISNEQFGLGGTAGVRGYEEGEVYGDTGWRGLLDLRAPAVNVGYFPTATGEVPAMLRCSCFMDYGRVYFVDRPGQPAVSEWGTGLGFFLTAGEHFDARLTIAWALLGAAPVAGTAANYVAVKNPADSCRAYFSIGYQF
jgi:hemolysin activation/secretion protein